MRRLAFLALLLAGCGGADHPSRTGYVVLQPDSAIATETLRDWVAAGAQLSVIDVLDETPPTTPRDYKNGGGIIGRKVTVRVGRTYWRRPSAPRSPRTIRFQTFGWMMDTDQRADSPRRPILAEHEPRLLVGHRYLAVLMRLHHTWFALGPATMTLGADGRITSRVLARGPVKGAAALRGKTPAQAGHILARLSGT